MRRRRPLPRLLAATTLALAPALLAGACGGGSGAQGDPEAFCEAARENAEAFRTLGDQPVDAGAVGVLRDLADDVPEEIRSDVEDVAAGDYSTEEDLEESLADIREYLEDECGMELDL